MRGAGNCRQCDARGAGLLGKSGAIPMKREYSFQIAPRCSATSKRTRERCKAPAVTGWTVCRFHGARGGARKGKASGAFKVGVRAAGGVREGPLIVDVRRESTEGMI